MRVTYGALPAGYPGRVDLGVEFEIYVPSDGRKGVNRRVRRLASGAWECDCPDFVYRKDPDPCKHITKVRLWRAQDVAVAHGFL